MQRVEVQAEMEVKGQRWKTLERLSQKSVMVHGEAINYTCSQGEVRAYVIKLHQ